MQRRSQWTRHLLGPKIHGQKNPSTIVCVIFFSNDLGMALWPFFFGCEGFQLIQEQPLAWPMASCHVWNGLNELDSPMHLLPPELDLVAQPDSAASGVSSAESSGWNSSKIGILQRQKLDPKSQRTGSFGQSLDWFLWSDILNGYSATPWQFEADGWLCYKMGWGVWIGRGSTLGVLSGLQWAGRFCWRSGELKCDFEDSYSRSSYQLATICIHRWWMFDLLTSLTPKHEAVAIATSLVYADLACWWLSDGVEHGAAHQDQLTTTTDNYNWEHFWSQPIYIYIYIYIYQYDVFNRLATRPAATIRGTWRGWLRWTRKARRWWVGSGWCFFNMFYFGYLWQVHFWF